MPGSLARSRWTRSLCALWLGLLATSCTQQRDTIGRLLESYAEASLQVDLGALNNQERAVLAELHRAAGPMERIYWQQVFPDAASVRRRLESSGSTEDRQRLAYLRVNYGPWDRLRNNRNFLGGGERSPGAALYPDGLSSMEFEQFLVRHPDRVAELKSPTTLIRRNGSGFHAIRYETAYAVDLADSASILEQAARLSRRPKFADYLRERASALRNGDYRRSDQLWAALRDEPLDIIIGPVEFSEDQLMGIKAAYEAAVLVRDPAASRELERVARWAEQLLPSLGFRQFRGPPHVTEVWQVARFAGQLDAGVKTVALTLPNDSETTKRSGTRKLIFSNVLRAKFSKVLLPLAGRLLEPERAKDVTEAALLQQALLHEACHDFQADQDVKFLADTFTVIDELKADVLGMWLGSRVAEHGWISDIEWRRLRASYMTGVLRAVRMGVGSPHAQANAIQLDALLHGKAMEMQKGVAKLHVENVVASLAPLLESIREAELRGNYAAAKQLVQQKARVLVNLQRRLIALDTPVDVVFRYPGP